MKTTIEIAPALLGRGKRLAQEEHVTLRALVEEGLRKIIAEHEQRPAFRLRKVPWISRFRRNSPSARRLMSIGAEKYPWSGRMPLRVAQFGHGGVRRTH